MLRDCVFIFVFDYKLLTSRNFVSIKCMLLVYDEIWWVTCFRCWLSNLQFNAGLTL